MSLEYEFKIKNINEKCNNNLEFQNMIISLKILFIISKLNLFCCINLNNLLFFIIISKINNPINNQFHKKIDSKIIHNYFIALTQPLLKQYILYSPQFHKKI